MRTLEERFWKKVDVRGPSDCWMWTGGKSSCGYGTIYVQGKTASVHRVAWMLIHGEDLGDMCVCHKCDMPLCVNPAHLFLASQVENLADMVKKGHAARQVGEPHGRAKLTVAQVVEIRERHAAGEMQVVLAAEFGVDRSTIWQIVHRVTWKHV